MSVAVPLSLLDGWRRQVVRVASRSVPTGSWNLFKASGPGWLDGAGVSLDRSDVVFSVHIDKLEEFRFTMDELNLVSIDEPNSFWPYLDLFDSVNSIYSVGLAQARELHFKQRLQIDLTHPEGTAFTVRAASVWAILVEDRQAFAASLRQVLGGRS